MQKKRRVIPGIRSITVNSLNTPQIFGEESRFAIACKASPEKHDEPPAGKMAFCHLVVGNKLLGNPEEPCYLPTWLYRINDIRNELYSKRHLLFPIIFEGLTDREIFEMISRANQDEEEFDPDFHYLPQPENELWSMHRFALDETTDNYRVFFYVKDNAITFLIEDQSKQNAREREAGRFIFHTVDLGFFIHTIDGAVKFLLQQYPYLKNGLISKL